MSDKEIQIRLKMLSIKMNINCSYGVSFSSNQYFSTIDKYQQLKKDLRNELKREHREKKIK